MSDTKSWQLPMFVVAVAYVVVGLGTAALARAATTHQMVVAWRLTAWALCAALGVGQICYEVLRRRNSPASTALHAALAVAIGGFALALAATIHGRSVGADHQAARALALVVWPILLGVPAFLAALAVAAVLARFRRS